ncbi:MAG: YgiT-type zinc finger protein [Candidatus Omnitrophica bacterium]|nr:YgiT-type zinc finger protein [Candidatus Omnitrophota bacterium]
MNCIHCRGRMEKKQAPYHIDRKGYHLLLDAIPAWVCSQCGEAYFEESEVGLIQNVALSLDVQAQRLAKSA